MEKYTLEQHFVKMQDMVAQYLEPGSYPKDGAHCNAGDDDQKNGFFINDMIYMLDGPEQREAQSTPDELTSLKAENKRLREALEPFVDLRHQSGAWGIISKKLDDMQPLTVTVTKAQFRAACAALGKDQQ